MRKISTKVIEQKYCTKENVFPFIFKHKKFPLLYGHFFALSNRENCMDLHMVVQVSLASESMVTGGAWILSDIQVHSVNMS